jgi:hypothetical protein
MAGEVTTVRRRWPLRIALAILLGPILLVGTAWWTLALLEAGPGPDGVRLGLAIVYLAAVVIAFVRLPFRWALAAWAAAYVLLLCWWWSLEPSNDRDWQPDVARLAKSRLEGDRLTVENVRDFEYRSETDFTPRWETRTYDLSHLRGMDLFLCYWGPRAIAHTIMSWDFDGGPPLAVSIETRKASGQTYSAVKGFFKQFTLVYVVADERDVVRLRTNHRGEHVWLYRLSGSVDDARRLLLDYLDTIDRLVDHPAFYDALTENCTTSIRRHVKHVDPGAPPFDWRLLANGFGDELLYEHGRIDTSLPFEQLRAASRIDEKARAADQDPDFSARIRDGLPFPASRRR